MRLRLRTGRDRFHQPMTTQSDSDTADRMAQSHGAVEDGAEPRPEAAPSVRLVEETTPTPTPLDLISPSEQEASGDPAQGLLLVQNCTQTGNRPKRPHLPEPGYGWPGFFEEISIGFRPAEAVDIAASMYPALDPADDATTEEFSEAMTQLGDYSGRWLDRSTGEIVTMAPKTWMLTISGGLVRVSVNDVRSGESTDSDGDNLVDGGRPDPDDTLDDDLGAEPEDDSEDEGGPSNVVEVFSRRSRNRCRAAGASLDWHSAKRPEHFLLMITLTYPDDWRAVAPTPDQVTRHRRALEMRFRRATGYPLAVIWKREFQERGAPHLHLFGWWPWRVAGECLTRWLSLSWYEIVGSGDLKHFRAGTRVDHEQSFKMSDPNRVGNYFASYATKKGYKDYQNHAPPDWANANGSVGRYWGYVGLERLGTDVRITEANTVEVMRLLRGVLASQKRTERTKLSRNGQGPNGLRLRFVSRRYRLKTLKHTNRGFTFLTNDGAQLAYDIARALALHHAEPWVAGEPRPLP